MIADVYAISKWSIIFDWLAQTFKDRVNIIRYYNWKDHAPQKWIWFLLITNIKILDSSQTINLNIDNTNIVKSLNCKWKLEWWYVNLMRWNYLIPIDKSWLWWNVEWWLYTACDNGFDNSIVWQVKFSIWNYKWLLVAWFDMDLTKNKVKYWSWFKRTLVLKNGVIPVWLIYDNIWGVWFVWADVSSTGVSNLNNLLANINFEEDIKLQGDKIDINWNEFNRVITSIITSNIWIFGNYSLSRWNFWSEDEKNNIINTLWVDKRDNTWKRRLWSIAGKVIDIWTILNKVKKKSEEICRWRWEYIYFDKEFNYTNKIWKIRCIDTQGNNINIDINYDPTQDWYNPVLIVKWWVNKVIIKKSMIWDNYLEVYNDKWYILIDNNIDLKEVDGQWEYVWRWWVTSWAIIRWNFVVRGLIGWYDNNNDITWFSHKLYVHGGIASLNTIWNASNKRLNYLKELLWNNNIDNNKVSLLKIFNWSCNPDGRWTDGVKCDNPQDRWWNNSLVIIKKYFRSILLQ